jgi:hypothetical protein
LSLEPHLKVFAGFEKLEAAGGTTRFAEFAYKSSEEAYAAAAGALRRLIREGGYACEAAPEMGEAAADAGEGARGI